MTIENKTGMGEKKFIDGRLISYKGLTVVFKYVEALPIGKLFDRLFPTVRQIDNEIQYKLWSLLYLNRSRECIYTDS